MPICHTPIAIGSVGFIEPSAFLFDIDGTLVDSLPAIIRGLGDAYESFNGVRPDDDTLRGLVGMPLKEQMRLYSATPADDDRVRHMCAYTMDRFEAYVDLEEEFVPAIESLKAVHEAGIPTALVTSKSSRELEHFMRRFGAARWVTATVGSSEVDRPKPFPDSALLACEKLGAEPRKAAFIGDSVYDMRCAAAAGCTAIGVGYGAANADSLFEAGAHIVLETPDLLLKWVTDTILNLPCLERN